MLYKILSKSDYQDFVKKLVGNYQFIGPKKKDKATHEFTDIEDFKQIDTDYKRTTIPPAKNLLFLPTETLLEYEIGEKIDVNPSVESGQKILFGVHSCDINALNFLDWFFSKDFVDENYCAKRENLIVIGKDCEPTETCFCETMGAEYAKGGFDIFLTELKDRYFVRVATPKGNEIISKYTNVKNATDKDFKEYDKKNDEFRSKFNLKPSIENFYDNYELIYDDEKFWEKVAKNCFSCGSCNLVCPTCFCFNVRDDVELNLKKGIRLREWDSCMMPEYGLVAGNHNFRPTKENRLKQRYRCKLKTFLDKYGAYSCVGCGRCIEACLVKINISEDINSVKREVSI